MSKTKTRSKKLKKNFPVNPLFVFSFLFISLSAIIFSKQEFFSGSDVESAEEKISLTLYYNLEYHFVIPEIPNGNAVLLKRTSAGSSIMFDIGDIPFGKSLPQQLSDLGVDKINVILSHCHPDHAGGILPVLSENPNLVEKIFRPIGENFPDCLLNGKSAEEIAVYKPALLSNASKFISISGNESVINKILGEGLSITQPKYNTSIIPKVSLNDRSLNLCITLENGKTSLLFGDASVKALDSLFTKTKFIKCLKKANLILADHHGNKLENSGEILDRMRNLRGGKPLDYLVISAQRQGPNSDVNTERIKKGLNANKAYKTAHGTVFLDCSTGKAVCAAHQIPRVQSSFLANQGDESDQVDNDLQ